MASGTEPRPISTMTYKGSVINNLPTSEMVYNIDKTDFNNYATGTYLIVCTPWSTEGKSDIYLVSYSGDLVTYCAAMKISNNIGSTLVTVDRTNGTFTVTGNHIIYALTR